MVGKKLVNHLLASCFFFFPGIALTSENQVIHLSGAYQTDLVRPDTRLGSTEPYFVRAFVQNTNESATEQRIQQRNKYASNSNRNI